MTVQAHINLKALQHNYQHLKQRGGKQQLIAVIKGDAYGHGAVQVARALPNADYFAVARIEEAVELRESGITQPILLLEGCFNRQQLQLAAKLNLATTIHSMYQVEDLERAQLTAPLSVWLKIDTGMHRLGITPNDVATYVSRIENTRKINTPVHFISHFSSADELNSTKTAQQLALFSQATQGFDGLKSIANSAGILLWSAAQYDVARTGISLFGVSPNPEHSYQAHGLERVMSLHTQLIAVRPHQAQHPVGYGETWFAPQVTHIGVVALGYGDGFPRNAPEGTPIVINGRKVPLVGRVSMDMLTVDLGQNCQDKAGDTVEIWGDHNAIEPLAQVLETIPYELMIKLTTRVRRCYQ